MRKLFTLCLLVFTLSASAQWQQTGSKVRYVNGLGIPTKDTAAGVAADSSQILIRPQDSALYIKYKRTWVKVGSGGGGTIGGSGTINRVPKFTASTTLGNSQITDNGTSVGINQTSPIYQLHVTSGGSAVVFTDAGTSAVIAGTNPGATISKRLSLRGDTLTMTGGGINGSDHLLISGTGNIGIGYTAPAAKLAVSGTTLINTNTDNGTDKLQVSGGLNVSARATAQNLSVTNNISVTNDINQGSGTANTNYTILANGTSSGWAGRMLGDYATGQFYFQHRNNTPTWTNCFSLNANGGKGGTTFYDNAFIGGDGWLTVNGSSNNGVDKLQVVGSIAAIGMKQNYVAKTGAYTATDADYVIDCTSGTFTVTLPASSGRTGRILIIKNSGAGTITVDGNASETIDGAATYSLSVQYATVQIMSDGTNWKIIAKF
jgi:hypothetical protein